MQHMGKLKYRLAEVIISSSVVLEASLLGRCVCGGGGEGVLIKAKGD